MNISINDVCSTSSNGEQKWDLSGWEANLSLLPALPGDNLARSLSIEYCYCNNMLVLLYA